MKPTRKQIAEIRRTCHRGEFRRARRHYRRLTETVDSPSPTGIVRLLDLRYQLHPPADRAGYRRELMLVSSRRDELRDELGPRERLRLDLLTAELALKSGRFDLSERLLDNALDIPCKQAHFRLWCRARLDRAELYAHRLRFGESSKLIAEVRNGLGTLPTETELPLALRAAWLGRMARFWADSGEGLKLLELRLSRQGYRGLLPSVYLLQAGAALQEMRHDRAERLLERYRRAVPARARRPEHCAYFRLIGATLDLHELRESEFRESVEICRKLAQSQELHPTLELLHGCVEASAELNFDRPVEARRALHNLKREGVDRETSPLRCYYRYLRARAELQARNHQETERELEMARERLNSANRPLMSCLISLLEAKHRLREESFLRGRYWISEAIEQAQGTGLDSLEAQAHLLLAELARERSNIDDLRKHLERAAERIEQPTPRLKDHLEELRSEIEAISELRIV